MPRAWPATSPSARTRRWRPSTDLRSHGIVNRASELKHVGEAFASLAVKAASIEASVSSLSGGNQQKVVMARALLAEPGLIVADEPTQGVDVGARAEIYRILREVSNSGAPVIVNSSDAVELEGLCDKVMVMSRGRVVSTLTGDDVEEARIVAAAVKAATTADAAEGGQGALVHVEREAAGGISSSSTTRRPFP